MNKKEALAKIIHAVIMRLLFRLKPQFFAIYPDLKVRAT